MKIEQLYQIYRIYPTVTTDSRKIEAGALFFALKGPRFDGNQYAAEALDKGAAYAIVDDPNLPKNDRFIVVDDVLTTLQQLATHHRRQFQIPVLAITGSNGKTTTKALVHAVLNSHYPTHATKGNLNNHIGVPLTLLAMDQATEFAIVEMGMNSLGEIDFLCHIAEPTHGLITNIGKAHMEGVGGIEGVKQAKSELYRYLQATDGTVFVNRDERFLWTLAANNQKKVSYSSDPDLAACFLYQIDLIQSEPYVEAQFTDDYEHKVRVESSLFGTYNFQNISTAIALGQYFKVPAQKIKAAIETYTPADNRSQILTIGSNTFILDAYNANPTSMKNVLSYFGSYPAKRKIAILGDMLEIGATTIAEHRNILDYALQLQLQQVIIVGKAFAAFADQTLHFEQVKDLKSWFDTQQFEHTTFLVKGSRSMQLEKLLD